MNVIRQVLAAILLAAVATSAAHARHHGKATGNASRHVRQHHQAVPAPIVRPGSNAVVETNAPASANSAGTRGPDDAQRDPGADRVAEPGHKGARTRPADRDHRGSVPHPNRGAEGTGHAAGTSGHHAVNVDLIFVRPSGRDARHPIKAGQTKKAASARPAGATNFRRQRLDPGATAKNAIGVATKPAGVNAAGPGQTGPSLNAVGAARAGPMGAQGGAPGLNPAPPGNAVKPSSTIGPVNAGHTPLGPAGVAAAPPNGAGISGTGLGRPGSGPGTIGGPAKLVAGISGTGMRPKR